MFLNVCKQTFHISDVRIFQKGKSVLMWNLQHIFSIWRRRYWQIFKSAFVYLEKAYFHGLVHDFVVFFNCVLCPFVIVVIIRINVSVLFYSISKFNNLQRFVFGCGARGIRVTDRCSVIRNNYMVKSTWAWYVVHV